MKKIALLLVFLLSFQSFIRANSNLAVSEDDFKPFTFGLKIVPSLSFLNTEAKQYENGKTRLNFGYGLVAVYSFAPNYGLLTGLEINDNSGNLNYGDNIFYMLEDTGKFYLSSRRYSVRYLNFPLALKLKTNEIGYIKYYGQFGVDAGFRLKARALDEGMEMGASIPTSIENVVVDEEVRLMRLGLNIGLGMTYNLAGATSLLVGLNYNNGFTNMLRKESKQLFLEKNDNEVKRLEQEATNSYVTLTIGILF